ncbi:hypothetical protein [Bradyrhizobium pachyrhizi]|uniref:hypothetical protein n=2 Tax=Bradyrhizobium TaxID=374 RepID=UPI0012FA61CF|nr:hypothetical protein [Bradyrhizobium pachyrhizi]
MTTDRTRKDSAKMQECDRTQKTKQRNQRSYSFRAAHDGVLRELPSLSSARAERLLRSLRSRESIDFSFDHIQFCDRCLRNLPFLNRLQHRGVMKRAKAKEHAPPWVNSPGIDRALVKFVEALAIADARRDHVFENERLIKTHIDAASEKRISGGVQDEVRSSLCSVLDRASKRKID